MEGWRGRGGGERGRWEGKGEGGKTCGDGKVRMGEVYERNVWRGMLGEGERRGKGRGGGEGEREEKEGTEAMGRRRNVRSNCCLPGVRSLVIA